MGSDPLKSHVRDWQEMAEIDPLRAISGLNKQWGMAEFFSTAVPHMDQVFSAASSLGLPSTFDRALDFGCGAGRFLPHLEKRFAEVWGVDLSSQMIELAAKFNPRCHFYVNAAANLRFFADDYFDLIYSFLVLQHLPSKSMITRYVSEFMRILKPGGLAAFQIPDRLGLRWRVQPRRRIYHILHAIGFPGRTLQSWNLLPMRFTAVSTALVHSVVSEAGGRILHIETLGPPEGPMYYCTK